MTNGVTSGGVADGRGDSATAMDGSRRIRTAISAARLISQPVCGHHPTK